MIQKGSYLKVIDNSGAKIGCCIYIKKGYKNRYALLGDTILVSIKNLRLKRKLALKLKKGDLFRALIVRLKIVKKNFAGDTNYFLENSIILFKQQKQKQDKYFGTKIFGTIPKFFRSTKYLKLISMSSGIAL